MLGAVRYLADPKVNLDLNTFTKTVKRKHILKNLEKQWE